MFAPDPFSYAERQLARDRAATQAYPELLERKLMRMSASPLGYLRGSAALYYELLRDHPDLALGPDGEGWLVGDAHLENFGAFKTGDNRGSESVVFDVNDFDEAIIGPFRWDVIRLLASVILGGRALGSSGTQSVHLCSAILDGYVPALCDGVQPLGLPAPVQRLLQKVERRAQKEFLDQRTERTANGRRFVRGDRYQALAPELAANAALAFGGYVERLEAQRGLAPEHFVIEDLSFRVAGTGSLGVLRIAVLTQGKGSPDTRWIFDMKAEGVPAARLLIDDGSHDAPAQRVLRATMACLEHPPRMTGTTELDGRSLFVRRLLPQEDKLDLSRVLGDELPHTARFLGARLGAAHRRGATSLPKTRWTNAQQAELTDHAIRISGLHEAAYLALCKAQLTRV